MQAKPRRRAAPATFVSLALILGLVVAGLVALSGAEAASKQPKCGDTVTTDTTLHHNLVNCPNNGIIIGADDVTLDLNYHTIDGDGTPTAGCDPDTEFCDIGVLNDGHDGVTVMHGSVREFDIGVWAGGSLSGEVRARHNRLLGISASSNHSSGLGFFRVARSLMRNSSGGGVVARGGTERFWEGVGMFLFASHHVRILHNSFRHNGNKGIIVIADSTHNLIKGNLLSRNQESGIQLLDSDQNRVRGNRSVRDGEGILVDNCKQDVIARNRVLRGGSRGSAIKIEAGRGNLIAHNVIRHVRGEDGVNVDAQAKHMLLRRNRVRHSKDDGFDVDARTTKLTKNRAIRNGDLGIEAVRGVIDGGGNKASGNGDPRQCTHIVCK